LCLEEGGTRKKKKRRKGGTRHQSRIAEPQCTAPWSSMQREEGTRSHYRCCEHHESEDGEMHPRKGNICRDAGKNKNKRFVVALTNNTMLTISVGGRLLKVLNKKGGADTA